MRDKNSLLLALANIAPSNNIYYRKCILREILKESKFLPNEDRIEILTEALIIVLEQEL